MNTAETSILSENIIYTPQQVGSVGSIPIVAFPGVDMPTIEDLFREKTEEVEVEKPVIPEDINMLELAQKYYEEHRESLLRKYEGRYIAILNNKVIGSGKNFSKLAQRVYKKYGYQTIYMPFVEAKKKIVKIPSPRIKIL
jgi:hypothetical protein